MNSELRKTMLRNSIECIILENTKSNEQKLKNLKPFSLLKIIDKLQQNSIDDNLIEEISIKIFEMIELIEEQCFDELKYQVELLLESTDNITFKKAIEENELDTIINDNEIIKFLLMYSSNDLDYINPTKIQVYSHARIILKELNDF